MLLLEMEQERGCEIYDNCYIDSGTENDSQLLVKMALQQILINFPEYSKVARSTTNR